MSVRFNHTLAYSRDSRASARFLAEILGLAPDGPTECHSRIRGMAIWCTEKTMR
jgi:hypothetical protein